MGKLLIMKLWVLAYQLREKTLFIAGKGEHTIDIKKALKFQKREHAEQFLLEIDELLLFVPMLETFEFE